MTPAFVGFIVVALVGAGGRDAAAFSGARKNRLDLSVGIALAARRRSHCSWRRSWCSSYVLGPTPMGLQLWPGAVTMIAVRDVDRGAGDRRAGVPPGSSAASCSSFTRRSRSRSICCRRPGVRAGAAATRFVQAGRGEGSSDNDRSYVSTAVCSLKNIRSRPRVLEGRALHHFEHARVQGDEPQDDAVAAQVLFGSLEHLERRVLEVEDGAAVEYDDLRPRLVDLRPHLFADPLGVREEDAALRTQDEQARQRLVLGMLLRTRGRKTLRAALAPEHVDGGFRRLLREGPEERRRSRDRMPFSVPSSTTPANAASAQQNSVRPDRADRAGTPPA